VKIVTDSISLKELKTMAALLFGDMVKAVVDVEREVIALDAELHADLEALLMESGSDQRNLWGVNFYPDLADDAFLEFDSTINLRPSQGNKSRGVDDAGTQRKIRGIVGIRISQ
jgi:hypothetical protein